MSGRRVGPWLGAAVAALITASVTVTVWQEWTVDTRLEPAPPVQSFGLDAATPTLASPAPPPAVPARAVVDAAEGASAPGMTLGVAVLNISSGELAEGRHGARPFLSASLSKLLVVVDMIDRWRTAGLTLTETDLDLANRALSSSDDAAMNVLWSRFDGYGAVERLVTRLGLTATSPPEDPGVWGNTKMTAGDMVRVYQHMVRDMAPEARDLIVGPLAAARPAGSDGFDQYFGLLTRGASDQVYAKQAWVTYRPKGFLLHSVGVVRGGTGDAYAVALLSTQPYASAQAAREHLSTVANAVLGVLVVRTPA